MRAHENSVVAESKRAPGRWAGRCAFQVDNGSFGGRSGGPGLVLTSGRGGTAMTCAVKPRRLALLAIGTTPAKWWCNVQH
jgi:hypothetical protein